MSFDGTFFITLLTTLTCVEVMKYFGARTAVAIERRVVAGGEMADRLSGVWVAFDQDIREDDAEGMIEAIRHPARRAGVIRS